MSNVYVEIHAQTFTEDTNPLIHSICRHYEHLCEEHGFQLNFIDESFFDISHQLKSRVLKINGTDATEFFQSDIDNLPSIIFAFLSVAIYPKIDTFIVSIAESDIVVEYFRKENVVDSSMIRHTDCCVKLTHIPTGIVVRCQNNRSRMKNYIEALSLLKSKVFALSNSQTIRL